MKCNNIKKNAETLPVSKEKRKQQQQQKQKQNRVSTDFSSQLGQLKLASRHLKPR